MRRSTQLTDLRNSTGDHVSQSPIDSVNFSSRTSFSLFSPSISGDSESDKGKENRVSQFKPFSNFLKSKRNSVKKQLYLQRGYCTILGLDEMLKKSLVFPAAPTHLPERFKFQKSRYKALYTSDKRVRIIAQKREDKQIMLMNVFNMDKRLVETSDEESLHSKQQQEIRSIYGVQSLCEHPHIVSVLEIAFDSAFNYYVFTAHGMGQRVLKGMLFDPAKFGKHQSLKQRKHAFKSKQRQEVGNLGKVGDRFLQSNHLDCVSEEFTDRVKTWPEDIVEYVLYCVIDALSYLHKMHIVSRDIRASNIALTADGEVKLIRLDHAVALTAENKTAKEPIGNVIFMAPEVWRKWDYDEVADMWSFGVLALEVCQGRVPFEREVNDMSDIEIMDKIIASKPPTLANVFPFAWSIEFRQMVKACLQHNMSARIKTGSCKRHKTFQKRASRERFQHFLQNFDFSHQF